MGRKTWFGGSERARVPHGLGKARVMVGPVCIIRTTAAPVLRGSLNRIHQVNLHAMQRSLIALSLLLAVGCRSLVVAPALAASPTAIGLVSVEYSDELDDNKIAVLERNKVKEAMSQALIRSFGTGGEETLRVTITQFRTGGYGPSRMRAQARLISPSGIVLATLEADSQTLSAIRVGPLRFSKPPSRITQDVVNQIAAGL